MEDDLNFKAVLLRLFNNNKPQKQMVLTPQRFFGDARRPQKKFKNGRRPQFLF